MKYLNKYKSINAALAATGNYSPNVSYVAGSSNRKGLVLTKYGVNEEIVFNDKGGGYILGKLKFNYLCFTSELTTSTIKLIKNGAPRNISLYYSTDKKNWYQYSIDLTITLNNGEKVYFKGDNSDGISTDSNNYYQFIMSGKISASGNIMSVIDSDCESLIIPSNYCFINLFHSCTVLTTAPELPATTLRIRCYLYMFFGCTSLTQAPELPATNLVNYCYSRMFLGCTSLINAPVLPANTLANSCYYYMFIWCTNLNSIEVSFVDWNSSNNSTVNWLSNVSSLGTFKCPAALPINYGSSYIPSGWIVTH